MIIKLALFITHNIFLTKDQIDKLISKKKLKCMGVSVPVWINSKNSKTTEPASEVFCEYDIFIKEDEEDIKITKKGYKIFLCNPKDDNSAPVPEIDLAQMTEKKRLSYEKKLEEWWKKNPQQKMNINSLEKTKYFRTKIQKLDQDFKKINSIVDIQHTVEIKTIENLIKSLV